MNCSRCGAEIKRGYLSLCNACFEAGLAEYREYKRLFVDCNLARDAKAALAHCGTCKHWIPAGYHRAPVDLTNDGQCGLSQQYKSVNDKCSEWEEK